MSTHRSKLRQAFEMLEALHNASSDSSPSFPLDDEKDFVACRQCGQWAVATIRDHANHPFCIKCFLRHPMLGTFRFDFPTHTHLMKFTPYRKAVIDTSLDFEELATVLHRHKRATMAYLPPLVPSPHEPTLLLRACMIATDQEFRDPTIQKYWRGLDYQAAYMVLHGFARSSTEAIYRFAYANGEQYLMLITDTSFADLPSKFRDLRPYVRNCDRLNAFLTSRSHRQQLYDKALGFAVHNVEQAKKLDDESDDDDPPTMPFKEELANGTEPERESIDALDSEPDQPE